MADAQGGEKPAEDDLYQDLSADMEKEYGLGGGFRASDAASEDDPIVVSRSGRLKRMREILKVLKANDALRNLTPEKLTLVMQELGPTFVKAGQILSTRSEILPQSYCDALAKLRTNADPMPFETVVSVLEHEYGTDVSKVFTRIDPTPLGSASLAQVHRARLVSGEDVAVKVQRPGVRETMAQDIDIMRTVVGWVTKAAPQTQIIDLAGVTEELWASFRSETDFLNEARNLQEFREFTKQYAYMDCPRVYMKLCTQHVVVMEYIDGIPLARTDKLKEGGYDLNEIGMKLVDNYAAQVLDEGFFHADPHPGNIQIRGGRIVLIDLGMTGRLTSRMRGILREMIFAVGNGDSETLENGLLRLAETESNIDNVDRTALLNDIDNVVEDFSTVDLADLNVGRFVMALVQLVRRNNLKMPGSITQVARALVTLEGTLTEFIPNVNMISIISRHILSSKAPLDAFKDEAKTLGMQGNQALHGTLRALADSKTAMHQLTRGQLKANVELVGSQEPLRQLSYMVDRLTMAMIVAGLYVGSSIVYYARIQPVVFGIPIVGMLGYVVAFILSVWIVFDILNKNHKLKKARKR